jgi:hypothetical protein
MSFVTFPVMLGNVKAEGKPTNPLWQDNESPPPLSGHTLPFNQRLTQGPSLRQTGTVQQVASYDMDPQSFSVPSMHSRETVSLTTNLASRHSVPNLKRPFYATEESLLEDSGSNLYGEERRSSLTQKGSTQDNHDLLSFGQRTDLATLLDLNGHVQTPDIRAQIHGMFFLAEKGNGPRLRTSRAFEPELTCYRRNLFQVSGIAPLPRFACSVVTELGESKRIVSQDVTISATESVDDNPIRLVVIPWKTPPPNSPEIESVHDQEPQAIRISGFGNNEGTSSSIESSFSWPRLQFRVATANNGRRRELQQHFVLHLALNVTLVDGSRRKVCDYTTAPIIVRGRSPRNFRAKNEIPLVGSSAIRQEAHKSSPTKIHGNQLERKSSLRPKEMVLPQSSFVFDASHLPTSPSFPRSE